MATKKTSKSVTKTTLSLDKNTAAALCYVLGWVSGLVFLLVEKNDKTIRFHAMQSLMFFAGLTILTFVPVIGWILSPFIMIVGFIVWLISMYKAYNGENFELPVVGKMARARV
jgi:uncharacterized membrane protein